MAKCRICGEEFPGSRAAIGFDTCMLCGDLLAKEEIRQKQKRVGPLYNKGSVNHYLGSPEQALEILKTAGGRKNVPIPSSIGSSNDVSNRTASERSGSVRSNQRSRSQSKDTRTAGLPLQSGSESDSQSQSKWIFDHWVFPVDPVTGHRYKRAILKPREK